MSLESRLEAGTARVGILGMGYVGLPLAMEFCRAGVAVTGFDVSAERAGALRRGKSYVEDVPSAELARHLKDGRFEARDSFDRLSSCDAVLICVQTPLRKTKEPDLGAVVAAAKQVARRLKTGALVVLESTIPPGVTQEVVQPILEEGGRVLGRDFFLAFSPERVDPGNKAFGIANTPKVVGGADAASTRLAAALYARVVAKVVPVSSARAAEMAKLLENSFRAVNIALVNEMAQICRRLGLDVWEVIGAAASKPFGYMPFWPGPGIGGHCIPKDPQLLIWKMKELNYEPRFLQLASTINGGMPDYVVDRVARLLNEDEKALKGSRLLVLGVAYKANTSDYRESPALDVIDLLLKRGAKVTYHDPFVPTARLPKGALRSVPFSLKAVAAADCVLVLTAHASVDYGAVAKRAKRLFDARNATKGLSRATVERL